MFCPNCGEQLSDDAKFCGACGAKLGDAAENAENAANIGNTESSVNLEKTESPVNLEKTESPVNAQDTESAAVNQEAAQNEADKGITAADIANKAKAVGEEALNKANAVANSATDAVKKVVPGVNKTILLIACAALIVIIVVCIIIFANLVGNKSSSLFDRVPHALYTAENEDGDLVLFMDGKELKNTDDAEYLSESVTYAYNGDVFVYGGDLYEISGNKFTLEKEDIESVALSTNKNALAYACDDEVFLYKDGKETKIHDVEGRLLNIAISPNGNAVAVNEIEDGDYISYVSKGSKAKKFCEEMIVGIISDDASVMYCSSGYELRVVKGEKADDSVRIEKAVGNIVSMSKDNKKLIYTTDDGSYYYAPNLKDNEPVRISKNSIIPITPAGTDGLFDDFRSFLAYENSSVKKFTFKGDGFNSDSLASNVSSCKLSSDGNKIVYSRSGSLYVRDTRNVNAEAVKIVNDLYRSGSFYANSDLTKIYALNDEGDLVFSDGKSNKSSKVDSDVDNVVVSASGICCYLKDDTLYTTSGGSKGSRINKMNDVTSLLINNYSVFYAVDDDELYVSTDGKNFTKTSAVD